MPVFRVKELAVQITKPDLQLTKTLCRVPTITNCGTPSLCLGPTRTCLAGTRTCFGGTITCQGISLTCLGGTFTCHGVTLTCLGGTVPTFPTCGVTFIPTTDPWAAGQPQVAEVESLADLKAQLQEALAEVEAAEAAQADAGAEPQTLEEVEAMEKELTEALAEVQAMKKRLG